jgi:superfamily II DNA or RNA helicase
MISRVGTVLDQGELTQSLGVKGIRSLQKMFSISTPAHGNTFNKISSFKRVNVAGVPKILLPRFAGRMLITAGILPNVRVALPKGEPRLFEYDNTDPIVLTPNQQIVLDHLMGTVYTQASRDAGTASTTLQMEPGYGKTYLAVGLIRAIQKKTLIVVPNTYLLRQWVIVLTQAFPNFTIGTYYGAKKVDGDIVVSIINSAIKYPDYNKCGLVVYDESHMYCSKSFSKIFTTAQSTCCIGLTATPNERLDGFDRVAHWALGSVLRADTITGWNPAAVNFTSHVRRVMYSGHPDFIKPILSRAGIISVPLMVNQLQEDIHRNQLIVSYAAKLYDQGLNVFVFSDRREHLQIVAEMLNARNLNFIAPELGVDNTQEACVLMGGSTDEDIEHAKQTGRIVMTTYQYSGTGVSISKMNAIILSMPRRSKMKQILGRIFRLSSDETIERQIIDLVDCKTSLKSQYSTRKKMYIEKGADIETLKIDWTQCEEDILKTLL